MKTRLLFALLVLAPCNLAAAATQFNLASSRIYIAKFLKPGASKIALLPNPDIPNWWPEDGGKGIIEPNYPQNREAFEYARRKGRLLLGVQGIRKPHVKHVAILPLMSNKAKPRRTDPSPQVVFANRRLFANLPKATSKEDIVASQWQISSSNSWLLPAFNSGRQSKAILELPHPAHQIVGIIMGRDTILGNPVRIPVKIPSGQPAFARLRLQNAEGGNWSGWSPPVEFPFPEGGRATIGSAVQIADAFFTLPGKKGRLRRVPRSAWLDLHLSFTPGANLPFIDVYLTANPEDYAGSYHDRGEPFDPMSSYAISLLQPNNGIYAKEKEGGNYYDLIMDEIGLYCDDTPGAVFFNSEAGRARARIRLLPQARTGTWKLLAFLCESRKTLSPIHQSLFFVHTDGLALQSNFGPRKSLFLVILAAIIVAGLLFVAVGRRVSRRQIHSVGKFDLPLSFDPQREPRLHSANQFILSNFTRPISLQEVAQDVGISTSWLSNSFKSATGKNVLQYINELRVGKAMELLATTDLSATDISFQVGFNSIANFNRTFKKIVGKAPMSFRKPKAS